MKSFIRRVEEDCRGREGYKFEENGFWGDLRSSCIDGKFGSLGIWRFLKFIGGKC